MSDHLANILNVVEYLKQSGWKVSKSTVYQHKKEGKLSQDPKGGFSRKSVDKYASTFLTRIDGKTVSEDIEQLQREKLESEIKKIAAQADHWDLKTRIESGKYIDKDLFNGELAARASVFKSDLENFFRASSVEIIHLVDGDGMKAADLINFMLEKLELFLGRYAEPKEFKIDEH